MSLRAFIVPLPPVAMITGPKFRCAARLVNTCPLAPDCSAQDKLRPLNRAFRRYAGCAPSGSALQLHNPILVTG
jgi:hypothetical protein